jgi:hypothetical protein
MTSAYYLENFPHQQTVTAQNRDENTRYSGRFVEMRVYQKQESVSLP